MKLYYLYNRSLSQILWILKDESNNTFDSGETDSLEELNNLNFSELYGYVIDPSIKSKSLYVPPSSDKEIVKLIPFLLKDQLLGPIEDNHIVASKREEDGRIQVTLVPKLILNELQKHSSALSLKKQEIYPFAAEIGNTENKAILVLINNLATINFNSSWYWSSSSESILPLLQKGLTDYGCSNLEIIIFDDSNAKMISNLGIDYELSKYESLIEFFELVISSKNQSFNLLKGSYLTKIPWMLHLDYWKKGLFILIAILLINLSVSAFEIYQKQSAINYFENDMKALVKKEFPEKTNLSLKKTISSILKNAEILKKDSFINTIANLSQIIVNNENVSLYSITFDQTRNLLSLELECKDYNDLETMKSVMLQNGFKIKVGSSRRSGSSILSLIEVLQ
jgi:type II secretory pathway component PulL